MALFKWPCTEVWLICMIALLHLVLSDGERFVHLIIYRVHVCVRARACRSTCVRVIILSALNACGTCAIYETRDPHLSV